MSLALCKRASVFGYSYYDQMLTTRAGHNSGPQPFFTGTPFPDKKIYAYITNTIMNVVNSRLLFVDSESVRGTGEELEIFLDTTKIRTYKGNQLLAISLQSFSGYRNFPHVNKSNDEFLW